MVTDDSEIFRLDNFESEVVGGACFKPMVCILSTGCILKFRLVQSIHRRTHTADAGLRSRANPCESRWER